MKPSYASEKASRPSGGERGKGDGRLRVVIADDDPIILDQIGSLLEAQFNVVARAANGRILVDAVEHLSPAVVVTDITMPEMTGLEAARRIAKTRPGVKVVILSIHNDPAYVEAAFEAGASGYVLKLGASKELIRAIEEVVVGRIYRSPEVA